MLKSWSWGILLLCKWVVFIESIMQCSTVPGNGFWDMLMQSVAYIQSRLIIDVCEWRCSCVPMRLALDNSNKWAAMRPSRVSTHGRIFYCWCKEVHCKLQYSPSSGVQQFTRPSLCLISLATFIASSSFHRVAHRPASLALTCVWASIGTCTSGGGRASGVPPCHCTVEWDCQA